MSYFNGPKIVSDGLVMCLDAANSKSYISGSSTWNDLSGNGNNGTLVNTPTFTSSFGGGSSAAEATANKSSSRTT